MAEDNERPSFGGPYGAKQSPYEPVRRKVKQRLRENPYRGRRDAAAYQRKARDLKASPEGGFCWICGGEIDRSLPPEMSNDPAYFTVDHDPPLAAGGSLLQGLKPAHKGCNSAKGRAMQLGPEVTYAAEEYTRTETGWTRTPHLDPSDPGYIENSRQW